MSVRIIESRDERLAVLYDSATMWAFGPVFKDKWEGTLSAADQAKAFVKWLVADPRLFTEQQLEARYYNWLETQDGD